MTKPESDWINEKEDIVSVNWKGEEITLKDIPVEKNSKTGLVRVDVDEILRAEQKLIAKQQNLDQPIAVPELLFLFANTRFFKGGEIKEKYKFNKMLFYLWKSLEKQGFGESYIIDEFVSGRAGPIPKHLKKSMMELEKKGLVKISWSDNISKPSIFTLTSKGMDVSRDIWEQTPDPVKKTVIQIKEEIALLDPTSLKEKVHREFPEYKRTYTELDAEL
jgi:DNA-binding PadR family transcriptional regulator